MTFCKVIQRSNEVFRTVWQVLVVYKIGMRQRLKDDILHMTKVISLINFMGCHHVVYLGFQIMIAWFDDSQKTSDLQF